VTHIADNPPAPAIAPQPSAQEDREPHRDPRHYDPLPIANPQHPSRIMLRPPVRLHAEAGDPPAGSAVPAAADVLDASALQRLAELDPGGTNRLLERVLSAFQTSVARLRPQADAARRAGHRDGLRLVAHTLKSSSASIGALQLSQLCARIEAIVRANDGADLEPDLEALDGALDATLAAIAKRLESRG
jgi:HPt (histidine-containing phosphotransfer) domain-containing protein